MIISHKHKFIFIKTRKTAGSSIEKILYPYLGPLDICTGSDIDGTPRLNTTETSGHKGWGYFNKKYRNTFKDYFTFAVDRNPYDKMISHYWWLRSKRSFMTRDGFGNFIKNHTHKFNDWVKYADSEEVKVDKLIKYEDLHNEFKNMPVPYNDELLTTFVKKSEIRQRHHRIYSDKGRETIEENFANVINYFSYMY